MTAPNRMLLEGVSDAVGFVGGALAGYWLGRLFGAASGDRDCGFGMLAQPPADDVQQVVVGGKRLQIMQPLNLEPLRHASRNAGVAIGKSAAVLIKKQIVQQRTE